MTLSMLKKPLIVLGAVAAVFSIAAGGTSLAMFDNDPHFGGTTWITIDGKMPHSVPDIAVTCTQSGATVKAEKQHAPNRGQWFTFGPDNKWTAGGATCTAQLIVYDRKGNPQVKSQLLFGVRG